MSWVVQPKGTYGAPEDWEVKVMQPERIMENWPNLQPCKIMIKNWQAGVNVSTRVFNSCGVWGLDTFFMYDHNWNYNNLPDENVIKVWRNWLLTLLGNEPYCKLATILKGKSSGTYALMYDEIRKMGTIIHEWTNPHPAHNERDTYKLQLVRFE